MTTMVFQCVLTYLSCQGSVPQLEQWICDLRAREEGVRVKAAKAIAGLGSKAKPALPALIVSLKDGNSEVRGYAAESLGQIGSDAGLAVGPLLEIYRQEKVGFVALAVREALVKIGKPAVSDLIQEAKNWRSPDAASQTAIVCLGEIGPEARGAIPSLTELLQEKKVSLLAAKSLLKIEPEHEQAITSLLHAMKDPYEAGDDLSAAEVLVRTKQRKQTIPFLIQTLKQKGDNPWTAAAVAMMLWELGPDGKNAAPLLAERMKQHSKADQLVFYMGGALLKIDSGNQTARQLLPTKLTWVIEYRLSQEPARIQETMFTLEVLRLLGPEAKTAIPALEKLINAHDLGIREAARIALQEIRGGKP